MASTTSTVLKSGGTVYKKRSRIMVQIVRNRYLYLLLLPGMIYYIIFRYIPIYGITVAFKEFMYNKGILGSPWIGLKNFQILWSDSYFWHACLNTIFISFGKLVFCFPVPIAIALLLNEIGSARYKRVLQTVYTFPHFLSWIVISGIVFNIFSSTGIVNNLLEVLGFERKMFLADPDLFRPIVFISAIWKETGWNSIIYLASIASINPELYEAVAVDGANRIQKILHVTWPGIRSTVVVLFILAVGRSMEAGFDQIYNLYNPLVYETGDIIDTYIYRTTFVSGTSDFGYSAAVGLFKSVIDFALLIAANGICKAHGKKGIF